VELITWRGTPGVGDFMWALNCAHNYSWQKKELITLEFHWEHESDHLHHFEDPETIIERLEYLHNFYHRKDDVKVIHVYNEKTRYSDWKFDEDIVLEPDGSRRICAIERKKHRFLWESGAYHESGPTPPNDWKMRDCARRKINQKKVVIWRPLFNAETPRTWKRELTNDQWDVIINLLSEAGLHVVELTYRTPVSEALYHISTSRLVLCYDGMWHYIAKNLSIPMIIISNEGVTKYHTPHAVRCTHLKDEPHSIHWWVDNWRAMLGHTKKKAIGYKDYVEKEYFSE
jgi:hypothetical protein